MGMDKAYGRPPLEMGRYRAFPGDMADLYTDTGCLGARFPSSVLKC